MALIAHLVPAPLFIFRKHINLVTTRSKRWSGNIEALPADYLKSVMEKMIDYGDRVQFSLLSPGAQPSYQVMNTLGKTMAFDKNHHLLQPQEAEFVGTNATQVLTLDQIKSLIAGVGSKSGTGTRTARVVRAGSGGGKTATVRLHDQFASQRYEYYKNHRQSLPPTISEHSDEITELMKNGKSVEDAFDEVVKKYF
ncbi:hypothetical protein, partial [Noviherbaspirillum sp.]|uniref:hypothetical protein n=1 Tax=Noviherbaspirillum sp. TaxID=1926288 RepID=UPI002FE0CCF6